MTVTYPQEPLGMRVRVALGADLTARPAAWAWTDITEDVSFSRSRVFSVQCGSADEQQQSDSSLGFVIRNHGSAYFDGAGRYTSDNANSDLWPYFGVGLPVEFAVDPGDGVWHVLAIEFLGEAVNSWPGGSKHVALTTTTWGGLLRRLQRYKAVKSPLNRTLSTERAAWKVLHYWPLESATPGVTPISSWPAAGPNAGVTPDLVSSGAVPGTSQPPASSLPTPVWTGNQSLRFAPTNDGNFGKSNGTSVRWETGFLFKAELGTTTGTVAPTFWMSADANVGSYKSGLDGSGNGIPGMAISLAAQYKDGQYTPGSGLVKVYANNAGATAISASAADVNMFDGEWTLVRLIGVSNDSIITGNPIATIFVIVFKPTLSNGGVLEVSTSAGDNTLMPKPTGVTIGGSLPGLTATVAGTAPDNNAAGLVFSVGQVYYADETTGEPDFIFNAFAGPELALQRVARVCAEESVPFSPYVGFPGADSASMGPYGVNDLVSILRECELADHGVLVDRLGVVTLVSSIHMVNRDASLTIDGAATHGPLGNRGQLPAGISSTTDDLHLVNSVTATRTAGGGAAVTALSSITRTGRYDAQPSINAGTVGNIRGQAGWTLRLGQADGVRYAELTANLRTNPELIPTVLAMLEAQPRTGYDPADVDPISGIGIRVTVDNLPTASAPGPVDLQVRGWTMTITGRQGGWTVSFNLIPYWPWEAFVVETGAGDSNNRSRLASGQTAATGAATSTLASAATSSAATLRVFHGSGSYRWDTDDVGSGYDLLVDGEPVTVTAVADLWRDAFTRTVAAGGLGTPTVGPAYTLSGTAGDFQVSSTRAIVSPTASGSDRLALVDAGPASAVAYGEFRNTNALPATSSGYRFGLVLRRDTAGSDHDHYVADVLVLNTGAMSVRLIKRVAGTLTTIKTVALPWTYTVNRWVAVMAKANGSSIKVRAWLRDDASGVLAHRWSSWQIDLTDTSVAAGATNTQWGFLVRTDDGTTTKTFEVDNARLLTPQDFTVTRSVTGVVRAHAAGSAVELWHPAARSLGGMLADV